MSTSTLREPLSARITQDVTVELVGAIAKGARTFPEIRDMLDLPPGSIIAQLLRSVLVAAERVELIAYDYPGGYTLTEDGHELAALTQPGGELPDFEPEELSA